VSHSHDATQAHFAAELIKKRKIYPNHLKSYLMDLQRIRNRADYESQPTSHKIASRQLKKAPEFVQLRWRWKNDQFQTDGVKPSVV
jgi:hypothetical protein